MKHAHQGQSRLTTPLLFIVLSGLAVFIFQNCGNGPSVISGGTNSQSQGPFVVEVNVSNAQVVAGDVAQFIIQVNQTLESDVGFSYSTDDGTATKGVHYQETTGTAAIPAGQTQVVVEVPTIGNQQANIAGAQFYLLVAFDDSSLIAQPGVATFIDPALVNPPVALGDNFQKSSNAGQISVGGAHTCAIKLGALYCWGRNNEGQLGTGNNGNSNRPLLVAGMESGVQAVAAGYKHTCAIQNGALYCWGQGTSGELGDGNTVNANARRMVFNMESGVVAVSAGRQHTCAVRDNNGAMALYCWGLNTNAQVGFNGANNQQVPYRVYESGVTAVGAGVGSTCVVRNGGIVCWGRNNEGQSGIGSNTNNITRNPTAQNLTPIVGLEQNIEQVAISGYTTCAIRNDGRAYCWGNNATNNLGNGLTGNILSPLGITGFDTGTQHVTASTDHTCAIKDSQIYCWGDNNHGELGDGSQTDKTTSMVTPIGVTLNPGEFWLMVAGGAGDGDNDNEATTHTCARTTAGRVFCWGYNGQGQVGDGTNANKLLPTEITFFSM